MPSEDGIEKRAEQLIDGYESDLAELPDDFDGLNVMGARTARGPIVKRRLLSYLIRELDNRNVDTSGLTRRYSELNDKIDARVGEAYLERLHEEFQHLVEGYPSTVCYFLELDPINIELGNDLDQRDAIEILFLELEGSFDLSDERIRISALDSVLECRYEMAIDTIMEYSNVVEKPYFPDRFWWRHPSDVVNSVE